jgi:hypothetical protein
VTIEFDRQFAFTLKRGFLAGYLQVGPVRVLWF